MKENGFNTHFPYLLTILCVVRLNPKTIEVKLSPLGWKIPLEKHSHFDNVDLLKNALRQTHFAIQEFHRRGFVHHDIRWPNIVRDGIYFILIDYDHAREMGKDGWVRKIDVNLDENSHWIQRLREKHSVEVDYWGFGNLMRSFYGCSGVEANAIRQAGLSICSKLEADPDKPFNLESFKEEFGTLS